MKYVANPVLVDAEIIAFLGPINCDGTMDLLLRSGRPVTASAAQMSRYIPQEGDYWVRQEDGYEYLNPKAVFERKYRPLAKQGQAPA